VELIDGLEKKEGGEKAELGYVARWDLLEGEKKLVMAVKL